MRRQESERRSSGNNTETAKEKLHAKAVGCMSGFFHFLSSYHNRTKLLTFGKKLEKNASKKKSSSSAKADVIPSEVRQEQTTVPENSAVHRISGENLVARLMGLEVPPPVKNIQSPARNIPVKGENIPADRRQQLLGALEKCDRDLKELKKIIEAVRATEPLHPPSPPPVSFDGGFDGVKGLEVGNDERPSPVSVLDEFAMNRTLPLSSQFSKRLSFSHEPQSIIRRRPGEEEGFSISRSILHRITHETLQRKPATTLFHAPSYPHAPPPVRAPVGGRAMRESVEEVCKNIKWGEEREKGRIALALQDHIFGDLIEDIVVDFGPWRFFYGTSKYSVPSIPFEACKRRLCF